MGIRLVRMNEPCGWHPAAAASDSTARQTKFRLSAGAESINLDDEAGSYKNLKSPLPSSPRGRPTSRADASCARGKTSQARHRCVRPVHLPCGRHQFAAVAGRTRTLDDDGELPVAKGGHSDESDGQQGVHDHMYLLHSCTQTLRMARRCETACVSAPRHRHSLPSPSGHGTLVRVIGCLALQLESRLERRLGGDRQRSGSVPRRSGRCVHTCPHQYLLTLQGARIVHRD